MIYYMTVPWPMPSTRGQKSICASDIQQGVQQHSFCNNVLLYVQRIVIRITENSLHGKKILRYYERTSANTAQFQDSMQCAELQTTQ